MKIIKQLQVDGIANQRIEDAVKEIRSIKKRLSFIKALYKKKALLLKLQKLSERRNVSFKYNLNESLRNLDQLDLNIIQKEIDVLAFPSKVKKIQFDKDGVIHLGASTKGNVLRSYITGKPKPRISKEKEEKLKGNTGPRKYNTAIPSGLPRN